MVGCVWVPLWLKAHTDRGERNLWAGDTPTRVIRPRLRTNDYGVRRSTGRHDSQRGRYRVVLQRAGVSDMGTSLGDGPEP